MRLYKPEIVLFILGSGVKKWPILVAAGILGKLGLTVKTINL